MKINEVEKAVGITKKNIRFYEQEGLLHPARNLENGYRDYGEKDIEELKKIKLLRKLAMPLEEIRTLQNGKLTLEDGLRRHLISLGREEENLKRMKEFCQQMTEDGLQMEALDADVYLEKMDQIEQEGIRFMDVKQVDQKRKRWIGSLIAGIVMIGLFIWVTMIIGWSVSMETKELGTMMTILMLVMVLFPIVAIIGIILALIQRKKEIQGGEEDAAAKY